ncbi:hypothetical protein L1987_70308 [Smallanthus sonchifolius]|uniref:Uncharacterized protein n=1 Tax=Smallanthus sonchifolius TaxID=185202 RepID=A0ACB9APK2_9ASTR|nr:hypothetical protein L1987_70308 [Smallanthus sonchifolius]
MVRLNSSENNWEWTFPEPETTDLARGKRPVKLEDIEKQTAIHKRLKSCSVQTTKQWSLDSNESPVPDSHYNPLAEPCPVSLKLKKSRSLFELLQARFSQPHTGRRVGISGPDVKARVGISGPVDKLKASNFPAVLLKIGQWEYVSKYEGDLVAKCYFAKHKLVWEVLDGRLKNKIEIQWGDIVGLKANCPDNGPCTLTIVLGKQPLFFREIDPQPRKHTVWQPTSDFTGGEASTYRQHYLQCSQGVLNKHYEKLIQCDTRLNFLSQQAGPFLDSPFAAKDSIKDPNVSNSNGSNQLQMSRGPVVSRIKNTGRLDSVHGVFMKEYGYVESSGLVRSNAIMQVNTPGPKRTMSAWGYPVYNNTCGGVDQNHLIKNISQMVLNDTQLTTVSDEKSPMSKVNSPCGVLQDGNESNDYSTPDSGNYQV